VRPVVYRRCEECSQFAGPSIAWAGVGGRGLRNIKEIAMMPAKTRRLLLRSASPPRSKGRAASRATCRSRSPSRSRRSSPDCRDRSLKSRASTWRFSTSGTTSAIGPPLGLRWTAPSRCRKAFASSSPQEIHPYARHSAHHGCRHDLGLHSRAPGRHRVQANRLRVGPRFKKSRAGPLPEDGFGR
jgi:hypothetical protein